jgi:hypothetical protein
VLKSPYHDEPEPARCRDKANPVIDLTKLPESPSHNDLATSVLQFDQSRFTIGSKSLSTLQPGAWLNDEIINGTLRLLKEVSNNGVEVVDSLTGNATGIDIYNTKVLLPMLIGSHWVLAVYEDSAGLLVYDSLPTSTTRAGIFSRAHRLLAKIFNKNDGENPEVTITSPLLQTNSDDCGVFSIIAAFHETIGFGIKPTEIDPAFWRDILLRLLSPQPYVEPVLVETQVDLSGLPANARLSELTEILSQYLRTISAGLHQHSSVNKKKLASAELVLKMTRCAKEGAIKAGLPDAIARFQHVETYCEKEIARLRRELESRQWIDGVTRVCITN